MAYDLKELLALPNEEKLALANTLWNTVEQNNSEALTIDEINFIEERLKIAEQTPEDGLSLKEVQEKIKTKYGF